MKKGFLDKFNINKSNFNIIIKVQLSLVISRYFWDMIFFFKID